MQTRMQTRMRTLVQTYVSSPPLSSDLPKRTHLVFGISGPERVQVLVRVNAKRLAANWQLTQQPWNVSQLIGAAVEDGHWAFDLRHWVGLGKKRTVAFFGEVLVVVILLEAITGDNLEPVLKKGGEKRPLK